MRRLSMMDIPPMGTIDRYQPGTAFEGISLTSDR